MVFTGLMSQPTVSKHRRRWLVIQTGLNLTMLNMHADITQENNLQYYRLERTRENKTAYVFKRAATISMSRVATRLIM